MMKLPVFAITGLLLVLMQTVYAYDYVENVNPGYGSSNELGDFEDRGRVIRAQPVYETVTVNQPVTECWVEERAVPVSRVDGRMVTGLIGGILGGVAGHQVGGGRGRDVATVAGTLLGAAAGYKVGERHGYRQQVRYVDEEVCETIDRSSTERRVRGYRVEYRYQGEEFVTYTDQHPGQWIHLRVNVTPT